MFSRLISKRKKIRIACDTNFAFHSSLVYSPQSKREVEEHFIFLGYNLQPINREQFGTSFLKKKKEKII